MQRSRFLRIGATGIVATFASPSLVFGKDKTIPTLQCKDFDPTRFAGDWYLTYTNYKFWTHPKRTDSRINWILQESDGRVVFLDSVFFKQGNRDRKFVGLDKQDPDNKAHFIWRGKGLLGFVKNEWYMIAVDKEKYEWAVTYYPPSNIGTPEGLDIYTRDSVISEKLIKKISAVIADDPFLKPKIATMFRNPHSL